MNGQQLKNSILQWAIQGKLVPQDPSEGTAEDLLKDIRAEKEQLVKDGKLKKKDLVTSNIYKDADGKWYETDGKETTDITEDIPFEIPDGWKWCRIKYVSEVVTGSTPSKLNQKFYGNDYPFFKPTELEQGITTCNASEFLSIAGYEKARKLPAESILVTCIGATIGKTGRIIVEGSCNQQINAILPTKCYDSKFLFYLITSPSLQFTIITKGSSTTLPILNKSKFEQLFIPLPPLSEQRRIVAKIEELMPLVEKYGKSQDKLDKLNEAIYSQLEKSILQEAIQGKLVPQLAEEGTAEQLLADIRAEKERLVKEGKLSKKDLVTSNIYKEDDKWFETTGKETTEITEDIPFDVPEGWKWCRLKNIAFDSSDGPFGSNLKSEHYTTKQEVRIIQLSNIGNEGWKDTNVKYTTFSHLESIKRSEAFPGDIIIAKMMPAGRAIICPNKDPKYVLSSDAVRFNFSASVLKMYLYYAINSEVLRTQIYSEVQGITRVRTSLNKLREYFMPLPPLAEQRRIVAKIEELMKVIKK